MRNRTRNWFFKRMVLGFAVAALAVPAAAQARVDEGITGQLNSSQNVVKSDSLRARGAIEGASQARIAAREGDLVENARLAPRSVISSSDLIENVRLAPRGGTAQVVSSPGFDWGDAGIGAALAFGLLGVGMAAYRVTRRLGSPQTA
jgi:hypothetical protein